jgi:hypothetical protein
LVVFDLRVTVVVLAAGTVVYVNVVESPFGAGVGVVIEVPVPAEYTNDFLVFTGGKTVWFSGFIFIGSRSHPA